MKPRVTPFKKTVFSNGLTLLSERQPGFRSISVGVWVKVGTRHEAPREAGISHFLEHMLFKGTPTRSALDIARQVDQVGGDFNAFTSRENTCFHILMLDRDLKLAMDILNDVLLNSNFDAEEYDREKRVILQEIAMVDESPEELAHDLFLEMAYGTHPLGRPILGTETSVKRMRRADLIRFFRRYYRPENIVVSVSGNVKHSELEKLLKPLTKRDWPGRPHPARAMTAKKAPPIREGFVWIERPTEQVHLIWGIPGTEYASDDRFAALLLNIYLGGGMSSALFQEIREKQGLAYTIYSFLSPFVDTGLFTVYVATQMQHVLVCLKLIEESAEKLRSELMSKEELQTLKDNLKGSILLASDDVESRMSSIAKNEIFLGKYNSPDEVCRLIDRVTPHDLRRVARKLLVSDQRSLLAVGPKPSKKIVTKLQPVLRRLNYRT